MLKVIGAGFGRTGTASMKAALEHLGFGPTYHMLELIARPERAEDWRRAVAGEEVDWRRVFEGFRSTVDWPGAAYWRELAEAFPDAKVLLTVRDPEAWYESVNNTIYAFASGREEAVAGSQEHLANVGPTISKIIWEGIFGGRFEDKAHAIRVFEEHTAEVQATIPADRLLTYRPGDGWEPLCDFLGVDVPSQDYPHVNATGSIRDLIARTIAEGKVPSGLG